MIEHAPIVRLVDLTDSEYPTKVTVNRRVEGGPLWWWWTKTIPNFDNGGLGDQFTLWGHEIDPYLRYIFTQCLYNIISCNDLNLSSPVKFHLSVLNGGATIIFMYFMDVEEIFTIPLLPSTGGRHKIVLTMGNDRPAVRLTVSTTF
jgi:hypothetical protein